MNFHAIIFDLDGTLVETVDLYEEACMEAFALVKIKMTKSEFSTLYKTGWSLPQWLTHYSIDNTEEEKLRAKRDEVYLRLLKTKAKWRQGAEPILSYAKNIAPTAIVTGTWKKYVEALDENMQFSRYTETIITADDMQERMKPDPYGLTLAAKKLKVDPHRCLYVGDQEFDVAAANAAGMVSCLVQHTYTGKDAHKNAKLHTNNLEDLVKILQSA